MADTFLVGMGASKDAAQIWMRHQLASMLHIGLRTSSRGLHQCSELPEEKNPTWPGRNLSFQGSSVAATNWVGMTMRSSSACCTTSAASPVARMPSGHL